MLSDSAAKFIHDGLCAAFDIDPKGERMTAEQHTSIAHSDGDTPRATYIPIDPEVLMLIRTCEFHSRTPLNKLDDVQEYASGISRRLARPTPDQIRAAVYANCLGSSEVDDITKAVVALFDAEVKL